MQSEQAWSALASASWLAVRLASWSRLTCMSVVEEALDGHRVLVLDTSLQAQEIRPACSDHGEGPGQAPL